VPSLRRSFLDQKVTLFSFFSSILPPPPQRKKGIKAVRTSAWKKWENKKEGEREKENEKNRDRKNKYLGRTCAKNDFFYRCQSCAQNQVQFLGCHLSEKSFAFRTFFA
jgi:hypothetical protein